MRHATSWSLIVRSSTDGTVQINWLESDEKRKRCPGKLQLEQCAANLDFNVMHGPIKTHPVSIWMLAGCDVWLIALGLYFAVMRPPLLPEDPRFMGTTLSLIRSAPTLPKEIISPA